MPNGEFVDAVKRSKSPSGKAPILAIAMAIAVVGVLPGDNFDLFIA